MKIQFIVNPTAGLGRSLVLWRKIERYLVNSLPAGTVQVAYTEGPGHATELALNRVEQGFDRVVAVGGDGTVQEVANALVMNGKSPALGVIPAGKGNDFARSLGMPNSPRAIVEALKTDATRVLDLGWISTSTGSRYFVNMVGIGFDGAVAREVSMYRHGLGAKTAYLRGIIRVLGSYRLPYVSVVSDSITIEGKSLLLAVGNTPYCARGIKLVPMAKPDDGKLSICWCGDIRPLHVLFLLPKAFKGKHITHPKVICGDVRELTVVSRDDEDVWIHADGEVVGTLPATIKVIPGAIRVLDVRAARARAAPNVP
ncbi:MAG TPA: diacylglycerol kinase family lipid kinase [Clostridia bacterium]|nr:diacylglycerol kinase family lipid kinase [Clostridia bacterium]